MDTKASDYTCRNCLASRVTHEHKRPNCPRCTNDNTRQGYRPTNSSMRPKLRRKGVSEQGRLIHVQQSEDELARAFFFFHYFNLGRQVGSSRHAFDLLPTTLLMERDDSALTLAFTVASLRMWHLWRNQSKRDRQRIVSPHLSRALQRLQKAIDDPVESKSPGTVLAAFVLQFDESNSAISDNHQAVWVHHKGAMAIAKHQLADPANPISATLLHNVFQVEVSYALRYKSVVPSKLVAKVIRSGLLQNDVISRLDMIGVDVASCQNRFHALPKKVPHGCSHIRIHNEAKAIRRRIVEWADLVPGDWHPSHIDKVRTTEPPIITYSGGCDVYPSVQLADLWNTWRCRHLILLDIILRTLPASAKSHLHESRAGRSRMVVNAGERDEVQAQATQYIMIVQAVVDDVCETYPFFLGNVYRPVDYNDLASHEYPSCHDLSPQPPGTKSQSPKPILMSRELHVRHCLTQGPWFAVTFLTYLITLISDPDSMIGVALRPGQFEWLFQQFRRILVLWRVDLGDWSSIDYIRERMRYTTSI